MTLETTFIIVMILIFAAGTVLAHRARQAEDAHIGPFPDPNPVVVQDRTDLLYGYYGSMLEDQQVGETQNHINLHMTWGWSRGGEYYTTVMKELLLAKRYGIDTFMLGLPMMYTDSAEEQVRKIFSMLKNAGLLQHVKYLYPIDEPNIDDNGPKTDAEVKAANTLLRRIASEYVELAGVKLAVIYSGHKDYWPGLESYDVIGIDHYPSGIGVIEIFERLKLRLREDQSMIVVPGGASGIDNERQDPKPFIDYAMREKKVSIVMPFIWFDNWNPGKQGIRSNGMYLAYLAAGQRVTGKKDVLK